MKDFLTTFECLPDGTFLGSFGARRYVVSKKMYAAGRSWKLVAEELGGRDYISLNLYLAKRGAMLRPCEMPEAKVVDFVLGLVPDQ